MGAAFVAPAYAGHDHGQDKVQMKQGNMEAMGEGVVHSIDLDARVINLSHGPIPELKWPAMKMDLEVVKGISIMFVAFGFQYNLFPMYNQMKQMSPITLLNEIRATTTVISNAGLIAKTIHSASFSARNLYLYSRK